MDFFVHDNIENYNKSHTYNGIENTRLDVEQIYIPESQAFWFRTNYNIIERNVNLQKRYLHIHAGLTQFENMQFDKEPYVVKRTELLYNPQDRCIEIKRPKRFFRSEIIFKKKCLYSGIKLPERPITILGNIMYDMSKQYMHFILNYYPQGKGLKFHWELEEEPATMEQRMKVEILEEKIDEKEQQKLFQDTLRASEAIREEPTS